MADAVVKNPPNEARQSVGDGADGLRVPEARDLLALRRGEPRPALRPIRPRVRHPAAQYRRREIQIASDRRDALAFVEDQPHRLGFELLLEPSARPPPLACFRSHPGDPIHLSESVHQTGSSAARTRSRSRTESGIVIAA
jgi:hypothetical protein